MSPEINETDKKIKFWTQEVIFEEKNLDQEIQKLCDGIEEISRDMRERSKGFMALSSEERQINLDNFITAHKILQESQIRTVNQFIDLMDRRSNTAIGRAKNEIAKEKLRELDLID